MGPGGGEVGRARGPRVQVVGPPGAGKTAAAARLGRALGLPVLELDAVMRRPVGRPATPAEYRAECAAFLDRAGAGGWVVDGDDRDEVGVRRADADVVLWLDLPRALTTARVVRRALGELVRRALGDLLRRPLADGARPRVPSGAALWSRDERRNLALWTWRHHAAERDRFAALAAAAVQPRVDGGASAPRWLRVRTARDVGAALADVAAAGTIGG